MTKGHSANFDTVENEGSIGFHIQTTQYNFLSFRPHMGPTRGERSIDEVRFDSIDPQVYMCLDFER